MGGDKDMIRGKKRDNFYFTLYDLIGQGLNPAQCAVKLGVSKQSISYYTRQLKACGAISKVGYGVWEVKDRAKVYDILRSKKIALRGSSQFIRPSGEVRGHAFRFLVRLPGIRGWSRRAEWLQLHQVKSKVIPYGQSIEVRGHRIKVFNRSLDVYFNKGWSTYCSKATGAYEYAILELENVLTRFEALFGVSIRTGGGFKFKVCRQHYSLVRNALASQYLKENNRLKVYNPDGGLWFVIDNSYHLEEAETCHVEDAREDNKKVQDFFNGVKATGITPGFILGSLDELIKDRKYHASTVREHIWAIKELGDKVAELSKIIKKFK